MFSDAVRDVLQRLVHTSGDFDIVDDIFISQGAVEAGIKALSRYPRVVTDVTMVQSGLRRALLQQLSVQTICCVHDEETKLLAEANGLTRSAAGIRRAWMQFGNDVILAIGDAPTAVEEAVRLVNEQQWRPHLIIGLPVGFVGTRECKENLRRCLRMPRITNRGTRGGSPWAAAVVNAMLIRAANNCTGNEMTASRFDLQQLAENGLKRGFTTGTSATAAVKAALLKLVCNETPDEVNVSLPDGAQYLTIPIDRISIEDNGAVRADVIKDAGDDPDQTHRARIFARVKRNTSGEIEFLRGEGVGVVTQPGLQIGIGEPAINPAPRRMMLCAVREVLDEGDGSLDSGIRFADRLRKRGGNREAHFQSATRHRRRHFDPRYHRNRGAKIDGGVSGFD